MHDIFLKDEKGLYGIRQDAPRERIYIVGGGKAGTEATQEYIVQVLAARFGPRSSALQVRVVQLRDPAVAARVFSELLTANSLEEAGLIMTGALAKSRRGSFRRRD